MKRPPLEVWKFGGASLADAAGLARAAALIGRHQGPLVIVASALAGVTDILLGGATRAATGDQAAGAQAAAALLKRHRAVIDACRLPDAPRRRLLAALDASVREYRDVCRAVAALGELSPRASDLLVARGERLSSALLAAVLPRRARLVDAMELVITDGRHGGAAPDLDETRRAGAARSAPAGRPRTDAGRAGLLRPLAGRLASPRSDAAAPISPRRCWRARWARPRSCSGRTSPAS